MLKWIGVWCIVILLVGGCARIRSAAQTAPHLEDTEWTDSWVAQATKTDLPRVLLVGDSIVRAYYDGVSHELAGKAYCARYTTSLAACNPDFMNELRVMLRRYPFAVIHFNNGLHGYGYNETEYGAAIERLVELLKKEAPQARLIWRNSTPWRDSADLSKLSGENLRVRERNRIATAIMQRHGIAVDDLYATLENHPEYANADGVHFNAEGQQAQARQVAGAIAAALK